MSNIVKTYCDGSRYTHSWSDCRAEITDDGKESCIAFVYEVDVAPHSSFAGQPNIAFYKWDKDTAQRTNALHFDRTDCAVNYLRKWLTQQSVKPEIEVLP